MPRKERVRRAAEEALEVSILYLRCDPKRMLIEKLQQIMGFNSLFEMRVYQTQQRRATGRCFNSLFEMHALSEARERQNLSLFQFSI